MKKMKFSTWRTITISIFLILAIIGLTFHTGTGNLSAFGYKTIAAICPLGSLEVMLADKTWIPSVFISLSVFLLVTYLLGRVFCAWVCPVPLFRKWFPKSKKQKLAVIESNAKDVSSEEAKKIDPSYFVLGGALGSSFIFGFPVFCLICPIGLIFALIVGVWRLIGFNEPTWSLLLIPAFLIIELAFFRFACHKFCPLGALFSLFSRWNNFFRPSVDTNKCLRSTKESDCHMCQNACEEGLNLHEPMSVEKLSRCTKCHECVDACPMKAISFSWFTKKN